MTDFSFLISGSFIEFSADYSPTPAGKAILGGIFGEIILIFIVFLLLRSKYGSDQN